MSSSLNILAVGDIHLGTTPSQLPQDLAESDFDPSDLNPAAAWRSATDYAIRNKIDAVLLAGDVVESTNARFEAMVPLEQGVKQLLQHNIQVIAVAGNHDVEALPRLAKLIDGFCLLGKNGQWEKIVLAKNNQPMAEIIGWSFPERHVRDNPIATLNHESLGPFQTPCKIGLMHGDLDASGGRYAPIRTSELHSTNFDAWLLGHIHKPSLTPTSDQSGGMPLGYLGSLVGLDPTETGPHGPWLLKITAAGIAEIKQIALAPLRWEHIAIPIDAVENIEALSDLLLDCAAQTANTLEDQDYVPHVMGIRATLTGQCRCHQELQKWVENEEFRRIQRLVDKTWIFYNKIVNLSDTPIKIEEIAAGNDPAALLAQQILILSNNQPEATKLIEQARSELQEHANLRIWAPADDHRNASQVLSDDHLRDLLIRSGKNALHTMLEQNAEHQA